MWHIIMCHIKLEVFSYMYPPNHGKQSTNEKVIRNWNGSLFLPPCICLRHNLFTQQICVCHIRIVSRICLYHIPFMPHIPLGFIAFTLHIPPRLIPLTPHIDLHGPDKMLSERHTNHIFFGHFVNCHKSPSHSLSKKNK